MTVTTYRRGHLMELKDAWHYVDTGELADNDRPCIRCGEMPTEEGYDACLGFVPGVKTACCGHGVTEAWKGEPIGKMPRIVRV